MNLGVVTVFWTLSLAFVRHAGGTDPSKFSWLRGCPNSCFDKDPCIPPYDKCTCTFNDIVYTNNNTANPGYKNCDEIQNFGDVQQNGYDILYEAMTGGGFDLTNLAVYPRYRQIGNEFVRILVREGFLRDAKENNEVKTTTIDFHYCNLTDVAAAEIGNVLKVNNKIEELQLYSNMIGPIGASALAEGLKVNTGLKILNLAENEIRAEGAAALAEMLVDNKHLKELHLSMDTIGEASARGLADAFRKRTFSRNAEIIFTVKGHNYQVGRNNIEDAGLADIAVSLQNNTSLEYLDVGENLIGPSGAGAIARTLKWTRNSYNKSLPQEVNVANPIVSNLKHLKMGWNKIRNDGVVSLADMLKYNNKLETLDLGHNYVAENPVHNIGDEGVVALADALAKNNSGLKKLVLWSNSVTNTGAFALAEALKRNVTRITHLDLSNNLIVDEGAKALAEALLEYPFMEILDLTGNNIGEVKNPLFETRIIRMDGKQNTET